MEQNKKKGISRLLEFAGNHKILIVLSCVFSGISSVLMLCPFVCLWLVIREILSIMPDISQLHRSEVVFYGWLAVAFSVAGLALYFLALMLSHKAAFRVARNMKAATLKHLSTLPLGFFTQNPSGKLRKIIDENAGQTETFLAHQLPDMIGAFTTPVAIIIFLFVFDWRLGILCLIPLGAGFVTQFKMMSGDAARYMQEVQNASEEMNKEAVEYVRGIPVVKVFQQTVYSFKSFYRSIMNYRENVTAFALSCQWPMSIFSLLVNASFVLLVPFGLFIFGSTADYTDFLVDWLFYILFTPACAMMINKIMYITTFKLMAEDAVSRIDALLNESPLSWPAVPGRIQDTSIAFENVTFSYPDTKANALENVSFTVPQAATVALVGASGSGKSTVANLVPRFYDVKEGCVRIGGTDVRQLTEHDLMSHIAFVFQNAKLFKMSILENIRAAKPSATEDEVLEAARVARCTDIIQKLPNGIHTVIGKKGVYLSGGEQQRIALARAVLKDAPIIVLDEASAFADAENEHQMQLALEQVTKRKTVLMIAHRLSTIQHVDQILVLDKGYLVEQGTHDALIRQNGYYARMWKEYQKSVSWSIGKEAVSNA